MAVVLVLVLVPLGLVVAALLLVVEVRKVRDSQ
jgi:hypothetical protein